MLSFVDRAQLEWYRTYASNLPQCYNHVLIYSRILYLLSGEAGCRHK